MAQQVKAGSYIYRINPSNDRELQRCSIGATSWSRVCDFNGNHILDLILASNGKDIEFIPTDTSILKCIVEGFVRNKLLDKVAWKYWQ